MIDTHCHLTFPQLAHDVDGVLQRAVQAGVTAWITIGTQANENARVVDLARARKNLYAAIGIHPHEAKDANDAAFSQMLELAKNPKVVAIGEAGLDYHYDLSPRDIQKHVFIRHIEIAAETGLPLVIHSRQAFDDTLSILDEFGSGLKKVVFHCFTGPPEQAKVLLDKGFYMSFTGAVTFKNASAVRESAELVPLTKMMLETDSPYMSPEPMRKQKTNEPALMVHTAAFLAALKGMDFADFAKAVTQTSADFFGLRFGH
jgi:TatD DNase family protein